MTDGLAIGVDSHTASLGDAGIERNGRELNAGSGQGWDNLPGSTKPTCFPLQPVRSWEKLVLLLWMAEPESQQKSQITGEIQERSQAEYNVSISYVPFAHSAYAGVMSLAQVIRGYLP